MDDKCSIKHHHRHWSCREREEKQRVKLKIKSTKLKEWWKKRNNRSFTSWARFRESFHFPFSPFIAPLILKHSIGNWWEIDVFCHEREKQEWGTEIRIRVNIKQMMRRKLWQILIIRFPRIGGFRDSKNCCVECEKGCLRNAWETQKFELGVSGLRSFRKYEVFFILLKR